MTVLRRAFLALARFFSWPLRRLLDGRFEGVHKNIDFSRENLRQDIDSYAIAARENLTYLDRQLEAISSRLGRIERDRSDLEEAPRNLEDLDPVVADLLNFETGPQGFAAQGGLWFNPPIWVEYREGSVEIKAINERIAEVPFAIGAISRLELPARVLDVGSAESTLPLSLASLGYEVTAVDPRPIPYSHPLLEVVEARLDEFEAEPGSFDAACLVSTVEHIGLAEYGQEAAADGADREALERIAGLLRNGGYVVLTVPYGEPRPGPQQRIYDDAGLDRLLDGWQIRERSVLTRVDRRTWMRAQRADTGPGGGESVAMIVAIPPQAA